MFLLINENDIFEPAITSTVNDFAAKCIYSFFTGHLEDAKIPN